jgi:hypothetical protein
MPNQPVAYSHALHAGELGMDCRYCHNVVERSRQGGGAAGRDLHELPPDGEAQEREAARRSARPSSRTRRCKWIRVTDLPDYVYFNHSGPRHPRRRLRVVSRPGRSDGQGLPERKPLTMQWCLDCHRDPTPNLRDPANVTQMGYKAAPGEGAKIEKDLRINPPTDCTTCHR